MVYKGIFQECVKDSTNTTFQDCFRVEPLLRKKHFRSSHQRCSTKKSILRNFTKFTGKHLFWSVLKKRLWRRCFRVNFAKFLRTLFCRTRKLLCSKYFPHFLACWLNTESYFLRIQSECWKMREKCGPEKLRTRTLFTQWMLLWNFIEITLWHECSPINLLHIFRTPFPKNNFEGLPQGLVYRYIINPCSTIHLLE